MNRVYSVQATSEPRPPSLPRILGIVRFLSVLRFEFIEWPCQDKPEGLLGYSNCIQLGSPIEGEGTKLGGWLALSPPVAVARRRRYFAELFEASVERAGERGA